MHLRILLFAGLCLGAAGAALAADSANLVLNGALEKGTGTQATGWGGVDGITVQWLKSGGKPGGCLRFDTSVLQIDKKKFAEAAAAEPPKLRSKGGQYDTVGAHEGVWSFPPPITVEKSDQYFIIEVDVKGPERSSALMYPQVLVRGFQKFSPTRDAGTTAYFQTPHAGGPAYTEQFGKEQRAAHEGDLLMVYRHALVCRLDAADQWQHYRMGFRLPEIAKFRPEVLLLKPYAMWPLGNYYFDNLVLRRATKAEYEAVSKQGHSAKGFMPGE